MSENILFICNLNSVRSPMAAALAVASGINAASAGIEPGEPDSFAIAVMQEQGLDISAHLPEAIDEDRLAAFDRIICLTSEAHEYVSGFADKRSDLKGLAVEFWPTFDPFAGGHSENRAQRLMAYRALGEQLRGLIAARLAPGDKLTG